MKSPLVDRLRNSWNRSIALTQEASESTAARIARLLLPQPIRSVLHSLKKRLKSRPVRLVMPDSATDSPVRVVIYGAFANDWLPRLADPATWRDIPDVTEVLILPDPAGRPIPPVRDSRSRTVLIPLSEDDIIGRPSIFPTLAPPAAAVAVLRDKVAFAAYVERIGLASLCPTVYRSSAEIRLPCIIKPARASFGTGVRVLKSKEQFESYVAHEGWDPSVRVCQEFVEGETEYATHCVLKRGRVLWVCSFAFEPAEGTDIRQGVEFRTMRPFTPPEALLEAIQRLLGPLDYSGPCNVDYKLSPPDRIAIFEINPRFGGSLMLEANRTRLQAALRCIVEEAS
jgi:hypothetical protein